MENEDKKIPEGFILLARKIGTEDSWVRCLRPQHFKFMVMLLLRARWKAGNYVTPDGNLLTVKRGQYAAPVRRLAEECGVSYQSARTGLVLLARRGFLTHEVTQGVTVATILNYERYQDIKNYINAISNAVVTQGQRKPNALKKQDKHVKQVKEYISEENMNAEEKKIFDIWNEHPNIRPTHRVFTGTMRRTVTARLRNYSVDDICQAVKNYGDSTDEFWVNFRRDRAGWTLDEFLSRGEGAKIEKFLDGPINEKKKDDGYIG